MSPPDMLSPTPSAAALCDRRRALRHYKRAIAALQSEDYRDLPVSLRTQLLRRLCRERDNLLQQIARENKPGKAVPSVPMPLLRAPCIPSR